MTRTASSQAVLLALALVVWALLAKVGVGVGTLWVFVAAYVLTWILLNAARGVRVPRWILLVSVLVPLGGVWGQRNALLDTELLRGVPHHVADRLQLQATPALAPGVVFTDHPQVFFVHAPEADRVRARFGPRGATLDGESLGHGLFRIAYDPRRDGIPLEGEGESDAWIFTDGGATRREVQVVSPGPHPRWFCRAPEGRLAATPSEETDELLVVNDHGEVRSIPVGDGPTDCEFLDDDRVVVSHRHGPTLWVVDVHRARVLRRVESGHASRLALSPDRTRLAVAESESIVLRDAGTFEIEARTEVSGPDWIEFSDDETLVLSQRRPAVLRRASLEREWALLGEPLVLGRPAVTMARTRGGVVIATTDYTPDEPEHLANHYVQDQLLHVDVDAWSVRTQMLTARRSPRQGAAGNVDRGVSPMGIDIMGDEMRVAFAGTDEIWTRTDGVPHTTVVEEISAPHGVVTFASGAWSVSSPARGVIGTHQPDEAGWRIVELAEMSSRRRGERAFYESTRAGISCQACHLHGDTDFVLRNIGGRRLAPTLGVGGIAGTSPYLRDGSYPRLRDLDHLSQNMFRGFLRRDSRRAMDLEAYIEALPRRRNERVDPDIARERRGVDAFVRAQCPTCHAFPAFTHLGQIPLGALFPEHVGLATGALANDEMLDTPSLLSVSTHGPYLSDGRADDLRAVVEEHNDANRHGDTRALSDEETDDMIYFLEGL